MFYLNEKKKKKKIQVGTLQLASSGGQGEQSLHTITTSGSGGTIVQYSHGQDGQHIFVPGE
jgi:hypothetical protein